MESLFLKYGKSSLSLSLRNRNYIILQPAGNDPVPNPERYFSTVIDNPLSGPVLDQLFFSNDKVVIIVSDITRYTGAEIFLPVLLQKLNKIGISDKQISILFALGIHRRLTDRERKTIVGNEVAKRIDMFDHNPDDRDQMEYIGETLRGTPIVVNQRILKSDGLILTGNISFHYLAGFGGGGKALLPGVSSRESCMAFHKLILKSGNYGLKPRSFAGQLKGNILQDDILETVDKISPDFLINTITNSSNKIIFATAGEVKEAHKKGCNYFIKQKGIHIKEKADLVVVSCGGYPKDINFIQAHKSIDHAFQSVKEGGVMIVLAECIEGFGSPTFHEWFKYTNNESFIENLHYVFEINGQTAFSVYMKTKLVKIILISSLKENDIIKMSMIPAGNIEEALMISKDLLGEGHTTYIIPEGASTLPAYSEQ